MPKTTKPRTSQNAFGRKFLEVMQAKGLNQDFARVAEHFRVSTPSVYDWVDHGRFAKERYPSLVAWSGRSLDWWFDVDRAELPANSGVTRLIAREPEPAQWPFTPQLLATIRPMPHAQKVRLENLLRVSLDLPLLAGPSKQDQA